MACRQPQEMESSCQKSKLNSESHKYYYPNLALPVPVGILSGLLSVTPEWLSLAATLVSEAVPIVAGGALDAEAALEAGCDVLSFCVEAAVEAEGFVVPVRFITLDTDFLTAAALLALVDCCLALNCAVCFTGKVLVCDDDLAAAVV